MLQYADTTGYDACADLSWIVVPYGGTASSPNAIMLFHNGDYLGTDTAVPQGFEPAIERVDEGYISVTYSYPLEGDANAAPRGRATSTYTWSDATESVIHAGELPPAQV